MASQSSTKTPIKASCHCGAINLTVSSKPQEINDCQCTICRRYGAAWAYYNKHEVTFDTKQGSSVKQYIWGDRWISFNFCADCGCMCYWYPHVDDPSALHVEVDKMGVNTRMMDPALLRDVNRMLNNDVIFVPKKNKAAAHVEDRAQY